MLAIAITLTGDANKDSRLMTCALPLSRLNVALLNTLGISNGLTNRQSQTS